MIEDFFGGYIPEEFFLGGGGVGVGVGGQTDFGREGIQQRFKNDS